MTSTRSQSAKEFSRRDNRALSEKVREQAMVETPVIGSWKSTLLKDELTGGRRIRIDFPVKDGNRPETIMVGNELRFEFAKIHKHLVSHNADLPGSKGEGLAFVEKLVSGTPAHAVIATIRPGFRAPGGFVHADRAFGTAGGAFEWADERQEGEERLGDAKGDLCSYNESVGRLALQSPILTFVILLVLAACVPSYVKISGKKARPKLISETALFNLYNETTSLKTLAAMTAASVQGPPTLLVDWDTTVRGTEELLARNNDHVAIFDDTEKFTGSPQELTRVARGLIQKIPAGRSGARSKVARDAGLPALTWSCFGLSTSPSRLLDICDPREANGGQSLRGIDIKVPSSAKGGIFGCGLRGAKKRKRSLKVLAGELETAINYNYGVLLPAWIELLLREDKADSFYEFTEHFVERVAADKSNLEQRLARKFGLLYACGRIATKAGLLEWPSDWPRRAMAYSYRNALRSMQSESVVCRKATRELRKKMVDGELFPVVKPGDRAPVTVPATALGIRREYNGRRTLFVREEHFRLAAPAGRYQPALLTHLRAHSVLLPGHGGVNTIQLNMPVRFGHRLVKKPRFLAFDYDRLKDRPETPPRARARRN